MAEPEYKPPTPKEELEKKKLLYKRYRESIADLEIDLRKAGELPTEEKKIEKKSEKDLENKDDPYDWYLKNVLKSD